MYAITGITGQVGGAVASALLDAGAQVRAVARDAARAARWVERGCTLALAEMSDMDALARAFSGTEGVFVLVPPTFDPSLDLAEVRRVIAALRAAIDRARPGRVVLLSTVGAQAQQPNLLNQLGLVERELGNLGLPIACLRAAWFTENASWDIGLARTGTIHSFLQPLDRAIPMVATQDVGATAAHLLRQQWQGRRVVELQGPEPVSPRTIAGTFAELLGRNVEARPVPRDEWETIFRAQGMRNPIPRMQMLDGFNAGWIAFDGGDAVETVRGTTPLKQVLAGLLARDEEAN